MALRPANQGGKPAPAPRPAPVPQAPLRAFQAAYCRVGQGRVGRARAKTAGRLQRVLKAHGGVPLVQHRRGVWQNLALQPSPAGIAVAQHRGERVRCHTRHGDRPPERLGRRDDYARAREREVMLSVTGGDDLARNYLEAAPFCPVPTAHVAAIESDYDRTAGR